MTNIQILKLTLIVATVVLAIGGFLFRQYKRSKEKPSEQGQDNKKSPLDFYSINDGNQTELVYAPAYNNEWFDGLDEKYSWDKFSPYDNRFWEYMYQLFDTLPGIAGKTGSDRIFFTNLTRGQKMFYSLLVFNGEVDNGGVYQFFFNRPEFSFAVLETFEELKLNKLKSDYEKCLNEFIGTKDSYSIRKQLFNDTNKDWSKRWKSFTDGYETVQSGKIIEDYYYNDGFKKELYKTFVDYVDTHFDQFVRK